MNYFEFKLFNFDNVKYKLKKFMQLFRFDFYLIGI